ncbi:MAG: T9SS type A sorting domain-containing protein [Flavobacteriales bacterium]|nr:T9SS type A sorting domain-containing protein [Flavobacteriales bacterium]
MRHILLPIGFLTVLASVNAQQYTITSIAGTGTAGSTGNGSAAAAATVYYPQGLALSADGSLYFGQPADHTIRKIDATTGNMEHVAGIGTVGYNGNGGPASEAGLAYPFGLSFNADGDLLIAERDAYRIRMISAADGTISTFAGNLSPGNNTEVPALSANLHAPMGVRVRANGDVLLSVIGNNYVRYVDADSLYIHALAGTGSPAYSGDGGPALAAAMNQPYDIAEASNGDVYICDVNNAAIRKVDAITGAITTVAGIGTGTAAYNGDDIPAVEATLGLPLCIALDADDNLYISDANHNRIRRVDAVTGLITTIAGTGTPGYNGDNISATTAGLSSPCGMVMDAQGRIFFADAANHRIRMLTPMDDTAVHEASPRATITAYPSPATEVLNVRSSNTGLLELMDAQGRVVHHARVGKAVVSIPLAGVAAGLYTVKVEGGASVRVLVR